MTKWMDNLFPHFAKPHKEVIKRENKCPPKSVTRKVSQEKCPKKKYPKKYWSSPANSIVRFLISAGKGNNLSPDARTFTGPSNGWVIFIIRFKFWSLINLPCVAENVLSLRHQVLPGAHVSHRKVIKMQTRAQCARKSFY